MYSSDLVMIWEADTGSQFHLHGRLPGRRGIGRGAEGVILQSITGIGAAPSELRRRSAARQAGSTPGSTKVDERLVTLEVAIVPTRQRTIDEVWQAWLNAWAEPGRLIFHSRRGVRHLNLQLARDMQLVTDIDPHRRGVLEVTVEAVATDPYAYSTQFVKDFQLDGGAGTVEVSNACDVPVYPRFVCDSPGEGWVFPDGVTGDSVPLDTISVPGFVVDTNPLNRTIAGVDGEPQWGKLLGRGFRHAIPPRTTATDVTVEGPVDGTPSVRIILDRRWESPW